MTYVYLQAFTVYDNEESLTLKLKWSFHICMVTVWYGLGQIYTFVPLPLSPMWCSIWTFWRSHTTIQNRMYTSKNHTHTHTHPGTGNPCEGYFLSSADSFLPTWLLSFPAWNICRRDIAAVCMETLKATKNSLSRPLDVRISVLQPTVKISVQLQLSMKIKP